MARDYFQDIIPPSDGQRPRRLAVPAQDQNREEPRTRAPEPQQNDDDEVEVPIHISKDQPHTHIDEGTEPPRGIRNVTPPPRSRLRPMPGRPIPMRPRRRLTGSWMWLIAGLFLIVLIGLGLLAFRSTRVTVTPKTHALTLAGDSQFSAYPPASAPSGGLTYTVQTSDVEDSEVVPAQGTTHVERKASGNITVYNDFSPTPVKLLKDTRFQTPDGLIFHVPAEALVPGKNGSTPGQVTVTVVADKAGDKYNVGPVSKFTLPGLKTSPDMYAHVYAKSTAAMTDGFVGDQPGVTQSDLDAGRAAVRGRLEAKARTFAQSLLHGGVVVILDLVKISYTETPNTEQTATSVRINQKAHVEVPIFDAGSFALAVAQAASADSDNAPVSLLPGSGFAAHAISPDAILGTDPLQFTLSGPATLVWVVDEQSLAAALAGHESGAFQTIVNGFPGIQEAHARIEPFWKSAFPAKPSDIKIDILAPAGR